MAASVLIACGLNEQKFAPSIHISEQSGVDGSFLISSILGQRLRTQNSGVIFACLHHGFQHYHNAGMRLGYNMLISKNKSLRTIEPSDNICCNFLESDWMQSGEKILKHFFNEIENSYNQLVNEKSLITIVIDDLSFLLNLGADENQLLLFVEMLQRKFLPNENVTIITKLNTSNLFEYIDNNLVTKADIHIVVERLKSGNFKEVDGRLLIYKKDDSNIFNVSISNKIVLYKVNEKNIKIFNPGEIGVKV